MCCCSVLGSDGEGCLYYFHPQWGVYDQRYWHWLCGEGSHCVPPPQALCLWQAQHQPIWHQALCRQGKNYSTATNSEQSIHMMGQLWQVMYNCDGFLEKNRDPLSDDILECMRGSKIAFVGGLFKELVSSSPRYSSHFSSRFLCVCFVFTGCVGPGWASWRQGKGSQERTKYCWNPVQVTAGFIDCPYYWDQCQLHPMYQAKLQVLTQGVWSSLSAQPAEVGTPPIWCSFRFYLINRMAVSYELAD